jgi:ribosome modulation factor
MFIYDQLMIAMTLGFESRYLGAGCPYADARLQDGWIAGWHTADAGRDLWWEA